MAFEKLVKECYSKLRKYCNWRTRGSNIIGAEDLIQETLIRAWSAFSRYDQIRDISFYFYLKAIADNVFLQAIRKRKSDNHKMSAARDVHILTEAAYADQADFYDLILDIRARASTLSETQRIILNELIDGTSYEELAEKQGVPVGTIKSRVSRLREALEADVPPSPDRMPLERPELDVGAILIQSQGGMPFARIGVLHGVSAATIRRALQKHHLEYYETLPKVRSK